jgi:gliding motility-associated-like protein
MLQRLKVVAGTIREACSGGNDGSISISPSGGQQPYTFRWSNGSTSQNLTGLDAGTYIVTITDALSNTISGSFEVVRLTAIAVSGTVTAARGPVGIANGSINASVSGGKPDYTLLWSNGAKSPSISNLTAGQYCLSVTDKNGCTATRCFQVAFEALPLTFSATKVDNRCFGESRGVVRITINGGIGPYVATFSDGTKVNANRDGLIERGNLAEGLYSFVISDSVNVTVQGSVSISQPVALRLNQTTVRHDNENPGCTGGITIALSGGTAPYLVRWNSNNAGTLITNLCEGLYVPTVEDANGCMVTMDPVRVNTFGYIGNIIDNLCPGDVAGDVNLNVFGGSEPYSYAWMNSRGDTILRSKDLMNVASGTYRVVVGEASGNTLMKQFVIETESDLRANAQVVSNYLGFGVSCPNAADGILSASGLNGIGTNFMYEWLSGQQLVGSQQRLQNARAGTYVVRITDQGGCIAETSVTLTAPPQLGINGSVNNISCQGARDGDILISASGGVPGSIYAYRWSTGATGPRISFLPAGNYSATVSDANNCAVSAMFNISEPQPLSVKVETAPATVGVPNCDGAARVTVTGGTRPYTYIANVPNNRPTDSVFLKLCPGDYVLQVRDSRGCKTSPEQIGFGILDRTLPCLETRSVISPDGDGANDIFEIFCIDELSENRLIIFNQWGQLVFETLNYSNNWSGRSSSGEELPEGAYYYILEYTDKDGKRIQVRGSLTLLRN